jgi:hypothetical protein
MLMLYTYVTKRRQLHVWIVRIQNKRVLIVTHKSLIPIFASPIKSGKYETLQNKNAQ